MKVNAKGESVVSKDQTDSECRYYNWGGSIHRLGDRIIADYPSYPREYGARCEYYQKFFIKDSLGRMLPCCKFCSVGR